MLLEEIVKEIPNSKYMRTIDNKTIDVSFSFKEEKIDESPDGRFILMELVGRDAYYIEDTKQKRIWNFKNKQGALNKFKTLI